MADLGVLLVQAGQMMGRIVSEQSLREAMAATETGEPDHWNPLPEPHVIVARELGALMESLGNKPSPMFRRLLDSLG